MKAKIVDVKKIVKIKKDDFSSSEFEPPKNIEGFDNDEDEENQSQEKTKEQRKQGGQADEVQGKEQARGQGKGKGSEQREFKEIDPINPGEYTYEKTPWTPPSEKTIVGEVLPTGSLGDTDKKDSEQTKEKWKNLTAAAEAQSGKNIPEKIKRALEKMRSSVVDWREELRKYVDSVISKSKYILPSRRFLGAGQAQYGYKKYNEELECIIVAIDTSGSITDKMVGQFLSEVKAIVETTLLQDIYIIFCHSIIYRVDHLNPGDSIKVGRLQTGGTAFYPPFEWTEENIINQGIIPSVFIYFTDGLAEFPSANEYQINKYEDKVIWVFLTFNGEKFPHPQPFGERIDIILPNKGIENI